MMKILDRNQLEVEMAIQLTRVCSVLARTIQEKMVTAALQKEDRSPVTVADLAIQALVSHRLKEHFPSIPLVAEESSTVFRAEGGAQMTEAISDFLTEFEPGVTPEVVPDWIDRGTAEPGDYFWVLDPIDGTKGFLRGDQYVVALALVEEGEVRLGALGCPRLEMDMRGSPPGFKAEASQRGSLLVGIRGRGAWVADLHSDEFSPLKVSPCESTAECRLLRSVESGHTDVARMRKLEKIFKTKNDPVLLDSQAKYAVLAAGFADLLLRLPTPENPDYREKIWDHAAGAIIVEEAGGKVSDIGGRDLDFTSGRKLIKNRGIVVSNGKIHSAAIEALAQTEG